MSTTKIQKRNMRHRRIRARIKGTSTRPRLSVFKSNRYISAQLIDDVKEHTIAAITSQGTKKTVAEGAKFVGEEIAKVALGQKIEEVVFDRGGFLYAGSIKKLADSARESGLKF